MISPNQPEFFISKIECVISLNHGGSLIFYTKKSGLFLKKNRFGYIKFDFVISQSEGFNVHTGLFQDFINNKL